MASLSIRGLAKSFHGSHAVTSATLEVDSGALFAILGPSGCGKTTLLRLVAGFEHPDAGSILLDGTDITNLRPQEREIGMVFQNYALFPHLTVFENIAFGLRTRHAADSEIRTRVNEALERVKLSSKAGSSITSLSGGEQQRVAVARALVLRPRLLLFDEPLSNLDAALRVSTREEIRSLQREAGVTTLYVTHDQSEAMTLADRIAVMHSGTIEQIGSPAELYDSPATPFVAGFLGGATIIQGSVDDQRRTFRHADFQCAVPVAYPSRVEGDATLAVKPEGVLLSPRTSSTGFPGRIETREYLGFTTMFRLEASGVSLKALVVSTPLTALLEPGSDIRIDFDWSRCALFPGRQ